MNVYGDHTLINIIKHANTHLMMVLKRVQLISNEYRVISETGLIICTTVLEAVLKTCERDWRDGSMVKEYSLLLQRILVQFQPHLAAYNHL